MTKKEMYANIANLLADNAEVVEFCDHEIKLLNARKGSKSLTKTQKANEGIMDIILTTLEGFEDGVTVTDLIASCDELNGMTNQKISALLRKLIERKEVVKTIEGKKAFFSLVR